MKWINALWLIVLIACDGSVDNPLITLKGNNDITYAQSFKMWKNLKAENGASYKYTFVTASFSGFATETEITVNSDVVVRRDYREYRWNDVGVREITYTYEETQATLGTHDRGAPLASIDELYGSCSSDFLTADPDKNDLYFEAFDVGVISTCGYVPKGCMDDCFSGIRIDSFQWL